LTDSIATSVPEEKAMIESRASRAMRSKGEDGESFNLSPSQSRGLPIYFTHVR
jgi:hypothetical protein